MAQRFNYSSSTKQLIAQWRECSAIAGNIVKLGFPNHILVNKIMDYDIDEFIERSQKHP